MKKFGLLTAVAAAAFSISNANALEKCKINFTNEEGEEVGLIKEKMGDCATSTHSCAGQSKQWDPEAWIMVPNGACDKIKKGRFDGIDKKFLNKIDLDSLGEFVNRAQERG